MSAGIRFLVESGQSATTDLVTAWFVELMNKWFDLMSSRNPVMALSKLRQSEYEKAIALLKSVINLLTGLKIGKKGGWKPVQTGVILATQSILDIQNELLDRGHSFILTSRFSQDCLENLFSCVRLNNPIPSPIEFRYALRILTVAQFLKASSTGNYEDAEGELLADFLEQQPFLPELVEPDVHPVFLSDETSVAELGCAERNSLYYLTVFRVFRRMIKCVQIASHRLLVYPLAHLKRAGLLC